jgi:radical SAM superfamily enzyme YgiQ (UPF0313 family)
MIGFPDDTEQTIKRVLAYAREINPTYANFNIVTPYPGTEFFTQIKDQIAEVNFGKYDVYHAVLKYRHLTPERVMELHGWCFERFYFRMRYLRANAHLLWPWLRRFGIGPALPDDQVGEIQSAPAAATSATQVRRDMLQHANRPDAA